MRKAREKVGLTQAEVARRANISTMSYFRYETGKRTPNAKAAALIAKALETTVEQIFGEGSEASE